MTTSVQIIDNAAKAAQLMSDELAYQQMLAEEYEHCLQHEATTLLEQFEKRSQCYFAEDFE